MAPPRIVVAGASGFIGRPLCRALWADGTRDVRALSRRRGIEVPYAHVLTWDGESVGDWLAAVDGAAAVINLAGENIAAGRWTPERKRRLVDSRIASTRALVSAMSRAASPPGVFISASAVGIYGDRADEPLDESSPPGGGFLASLCADWEAEALKAPRPVRAVCLRIGVVLAKGGGALGKMLPPFQLGLGGPVGSGRQWMPWITRDDLIGLILHLLETDARGPVNAVSPNPVTNADFGRALGRALRRPAVLPLPAAAVRLLFGELGEVLLAGQRVFPKRALECGYAFKHPELEAGLKAALS